MELAAWEVLLVGTLIVLSILSKAALEHFDLPDLLGYLLIGVGIRLLDGAWGLLTPRGHELLAFLADFGVGVSVRVWRSTDHLGSAKGASMLDVAKLDDLSGVVLLALLAALAPQLRSGISVDLLGPTVLTFGYTLGTMALLMLGGVLFAQYWSLPSPTGSTTCSPNPT